MRKIILTIAILAFALGIRAQENLGPIKWISFQEAERLDSIEHRPFMIDVYTDWCGWCKRMMATTFQNVSLANYINQNFYCVRFDAETTDTIRFQGKEWVNSNGRVNSLAPHLMGQHLSYPTIVYIDRDGHVAPIPGYMEVRGIEPILVYFAEDKTNYCDLETFKDLYMLSFPDAYKEELAKARNLKANTSGEIKWLTVEEAKKLAAKQKRPVIVDLYIDDKYRGQVPYITMGSIVHEHAVLKDSTMASYINEHFYPIRIEATTKDSIYWFGNDKPFVSLGEGMPNQFTQALTNGNYKFPAMYFFNSDQKFVGSVNEFFSPDFWSVILKFYGEEAYTKESFEQFYRRTRQSK
ncbi:MAG: DUF255 domain-containing protein [Bacteroidales bacterium]|nr:DUF255 domain-containing protein [Bacteroidales bacterium]